MYHYFPWRSISAKKGPLSIKQTFKYISFHPKQKYISAKRQFPSHLNPSTPKMSPSPKRNVRITQTISPYKLQEKSISHPHLHQKKIPHKEKSISYHSEQTLISKVHIPKKECPSHKKEKVPIPQKKSESHLNPSIPKRRPLSKTKVPTPKMRTFRLNSPKGDYLSQPPAETSISSMLKEH